MSTRPSLSETPKNHTLTQPFRKPRKRHASTARLQCLRPATSNKQRVVANKRTPFHRVKSVPFAMQDDAIEVIDLADSSDGDAPQIQSLITPPTRKTATPLKVSSLFIDDDDDDDDVVQVSAPTVAPVKHHAFSDDDSDEEIVSLMNDPAYLARMRAAALRKTPARKCLPPADETLSRPVEQVDRIISAPTDDGVMEKIFEDDPVELSMERSPDSSPTLSAQQMEQLVQLNRLSADATREMQTPPELNVLLLKHQRQALAWMVERESSNKPPDHPQGGILADDQGFGKTLSMISLMLTNKPHNGQNERDVPWGNLIVAPTSILHQWASELEDRIDELYRPRVCVYHGPNRPRDHHTLLKYDVVITSYGMLVQEYPKPLEIDDQRNVIRKRSRGPLFRLKWFRVVLDEAQAIKNHRSETFKASMKLDAARRWALTGTPIQNTVDDIYSLFTFIRYFVVDSYRTWVSKYKRPMERVNGNKESLFKRFQVLTGVVLLRRAKYDKIDGKSVIDLPARNVKVVEYKFSKTELAYYHRQEVSAVSSINRMGDDANMAFCLVVLLRLRQACGHPALCEWGLETEFKFSDDELDVVDMRMRTRCMFNVLPPPIQKRLSFELGPGSSVSQTCPICMDVIESEGIVTKCGHIFCAADFDEWHKSNDSCPACRGTLGSDGDTMALEEVRKEIHALHRAQLRDKNAANAAVQEQKNTVKKSKIEFNFGKRKPENDSAEVRSGPSKRARRSGKTGNKADVKGEDVGKAEDDLVEEAKKTKTSTKITAFIKEYQKILETTQDKVLCFSQWTRMLDLVEVSLKEEGYEYVRLDGNMSLNERSTVLRTFKTRSKCRLFLISLKAGCTGLNLTVANRVFLLDSWWNPAVEDQAIDRVHRIGQKKDVEVTRMKIENSIEDRILALQEKKRAIIDGALGVEGLKTIGRQRLTMRDVMSLFTAVAENVAARAESAQDGTTVEMANELLDRTRGFGRFMHR